MLISACMQIFSPLRDGTPEAIATVTRAAAVMRASSCKDAITSVYYL